MEEEHKHNWLVVTSVATIPWDTFMRFRGEHKDLQELEIMMPVTHTVICSECQEIKIVE